jgi:membrane protease YdiL (CAAX protease family)
MNETGLNNKKIATFVILAYTISWTIWTPNVLAHNLNLGWKQSNWLHIAGGLGPFLSALVTSYMYDHKTGLASYFKGRFLTFPGLRWMLIGVGMPVVIFLIAWLILGLFSGDWEVVSRLGLNSKIPLSNPLLIWLLWCFFYGLGEEGGWRGFLFPELTGQYPARISTLYVAIIWAAWHLPIFFYDKDFSTMGWFGSAGWLVGLVFGSLLLSWLAKQAGYSLWPVILWHGTFNFFTVGDQLNPLLPALMSAMVILIAFYLARRYGENLVIPSG